EILASFRQASSKVLLQVGSPRARSASESTRSASECPWLRPTSVTKARRAATGSPPSRRETAQSTTTSPESGATVIALSRARLQPPPPPPFFPQSPAADRA